MTDAAEKRESAIALMREALALLDVADEEMAALHLQFAIDVASGLAAMKPPNDRYGNLH